MMKSVLQLVGCINDELLNQVHFGAFTFVKQSDIFIPVVLQYSHFNNEWEKHPVTEVSLTAIQKFDVPTWGNCAGLSIWQDTKHHAKQWKFTTGIHSGWQDGISGTMAHGTTELAIQLLCWHTSQA